MNGFHPGGGRAGIGETILPKVFQNGFSSTKEAASPEELEPDMFLEELQSSRAKRAVVWVIKQFHASVSIYMKQAMLKLE